MKHAGLGLWAEAGSRGAEARYLPGGALERAALTAGGGAALLPSLGESLRGDAGPAAAPRIRASCSRARLTSA